MKRILSKRSFAMMTAALCMIAFMAIGSALAYFTAHTEANGMKQVKLVGGSTYEETVSDMTKHLTITNTGTQPVYYRATAACDAGISVGTVKSSGWVDGGDGYWYCEEIVEAGASAPVLDLPIIVSPDVASDFNVVVTYEQKFVMTDNVKDSENWIPYTGEGAAE